MRQLPFLKHGCLHLEIQTCASLPSQHLPSSTDPRMIRQDPAKDLSLFGTSVSLPFLLLSIYVWFGEEGKVPMPTQSYHILAQLPGVHVGYTHLGAFGSSPVCSLTSKDNLIPKRCQGSCIHRETGIMTKWQGSLNHENPIHKAPEPASKFF